MESGSTIESQPCWYSQ